MFSNHSLPVVTDRHGCGIPETTGVSPRFGHRALARSKGGTYRLAHTHALRCTAVQRRLGQSPNDARRPRSVQQSCPPRARLSSISTLLLYMTALPLNKNIQRIYSVLLYHCRVSPPLTLRASLPAIG